MDIQVLEGEFVEVAPADVTGMDRRAFGEFVGPGGELASYAFGWTTGSDPHVARLSVGIGAGNPGGGMFHAVIFANEDGHAFSLVDEPFDRVPQGGPDLTASQARFHEDLPFVWWVTDHVMRHDRRAWWMLHWLLGTTCIQTLEVFERREPVLLISHDADDGVRQLIGASDADASTGKVGHLHHAVDEDPSLIDVLDLPPGRSAVRAGVGSPGPAASNPSALPGWLLLTGPPSLPVSGLAGLACVDPSRPGERAHKWSKRSTRLASVGRHSGAGVPPLAACATL